MLPGLCLAGSMGDDFRRGLNPGAVMTGTIEGTSHFDVMTKYWALMGWGAYRTTSAEAHEPYPSDWASIQGGFQQA